jgi:hypothetical protein
MNHEAVQLSHEELLLALSLLGLPAPLALGPAPLAPQPGPALQGALAGALGSLAARDLLLPGADSASLPALAPGLAALLRTAALAERCVVLVERRGATRRTAHISAHEGALVLHTSPRPGVHRLEPLADAAEWLVAAIRPRPSAGPLPALRASPEQLAAALDALDTAEPATALARLTAAGVPHGEASAFVDAVGPTPGRFVLGSLAGLRAEAPSARGAFALAGAAGVWWAASGPGADALDLTPVCPARLRREARALTACLTAAS